VDAFVRQHRLGFASHVDVVAERRRQLRVRDYRIDDGREPHAGEVTRERLGVYLTDLAGAEQRNVDRSTDHLALIPRRAARTFRDYASPRRTAGAALSPAPVRPSPRSRSP